MTKYRYVIVCSNGFSHDATTEGEFVSHGLSAQPVYDLPRLLERGWRPVRETPMGGCGNEWVSYALILLEKEIRGTEVAEVRPV